MQRRPWRSSRGRLALLAALVVPAVAATSLLLLRPEAEVLAVADVGAVPAAAGEPGAAGQPDGETVRLTSGGRERAVLVQGPSPEAPVRGLVMVLGPHGLTAARTARDLRFDALRAQGFAVAYPSTLDGDWNAGRCCGSPQRDGVDDVLFLQDARGMLMERFGVSGGDVGLVGYSTGGQMVYRVVCEHPGFARAAVVVAGSLETDCRPRRHLPPTLVVHGMQDTTVPYETTVQRTQLLDYAPTPGLTSVALYAEAAGCGAHEEDRTDGRQLMAWEGCGGIPLLHAVGMPGTGHGWTPLGGSVYATRFLTAHLSTQS